MKKNNYSELENPETWDMNKPIARKSKKPSRVVFSVAFHRDDFDRISKYAEQCGKRTSEFIREAAIEKSINEGERTVYILGSGSLGAIWAYDHIIPKTDVSGIITEYPEDILTPTS